MFYKYPKLSKYNNSDRHYKNISTSLLYVFVKYLTQKTDRPNPKSHS